MTIERKQYAMHMEMYKPLTPTLRKQVIDSINDKISELLECESNAFVNAQLIAWEATKTMFRALPDGYPIPIERGDREDGA